jgi:hypothetical protein
MVPTNKSHRQHTHDTDTWDISTINQCELWGNQEIRVDGNIKVHNWGTRHMPNQEQEKPGIETAAATVGIDPDKIRQCQAFTVASQV